MTPSQSDVSAHESGKPDEFSTNDPLDTPFFAVGAAALCAIAIAVVYAEVRNLGFVWDDGLLSLARVYSDCDLEVIFTSTANTFEYLPVRDLTLCVDHALWGNEWAGGFHLQNVLLFTVACVLLGSFYRAVFAAAPNERLATHASLFSLFCVLVFALHPLQVEPVAFITARNALLALVFVLATLVCYARWCESRNRFFYGASVVLVAVALLSKATALPAAFLVPLLDLYLIRDSSPLRSLIRATPHLLVTAAVGALHVVIASTHGAMGSSPSIGELLARLPRAAFIPQFYLYKFAWPLNQTIDYDLSGVREQIVWVAVTSLVFVVGCGVILFRGASRRSTGAFVCAGYLLALLPVLNLFPTYPTVADRYAQIPLVFLIPLVLLPALLWVPPRLLVAGVAAVSLLLGGLSIRQVPVWQSDETLFAHAVEVDPTALKSVENLGHTRWWTGDHEGALEAFAMLEALKPSDGQHALFQAWQAVEVAEFDRAAELLGVARRRDVAPYFVHLVQGEIEERTHNSRSAIREYERAKVEAKKRFQRDSRARIYLRTINKSLRRLKSRGL